jgi:paired amphipathic helix protein Sin3a
MRSQELLALLKRDRAAEKTTTRQQIAYRMQAEGVLGVDENLFKIEWVGPWSDALLLMYQVSSNETLTIQLLGKDDLTIDDASTMEQRWRQYIDSFVLVSILTAVLSSADF